MSSWHLPPSCVSGEQGQLVGYLLHVWGVAGWMIFVGVMIGITKYSTDQAIRVCRSCAMYYVQSVADRLPLLLCTQSSYSTPWMPGIIVHGCLES